MAKKRTLNDAEIELTALRAQLAASRGASMEPATVVQRYPCVMYKRHRVDVKHPNGYERRRVQDTDEKGNLDTEKCDATVEQLETIGWTHSPADLA